MTCVVVLCSVVVFFFKQKTAYEMRIRDWSSDVCSSDLDADVVLAIHDAGRREISEETRQVIEGLAKASCEKVLVLNKIDLVKREKLLELAAALSGLGKFRSEERRVGKAGVSTCRSRWSPDP